MTKGAGAPQDDAVDSGVHEGARREKMRRIEALGHDPWGGRFDERLLIGDIRARAAEIHFVKENGEKVAIPHAAPMPVRTTFANGSPNWGKGK